jgi:hypothetical protein
VSRSAPANQNPTRSNRYDKINGCKSSHATNNASTANATNYSSCIVKMCFNWHTGLYNSFPSSRSWVKDGVSVAGSVLFLSIYKAIWRRRYTNQYEYGALEERYQQGKAEVPGNEHLSHFQYVQQISYINCSGIKYGPPNKDRDDGTRQTHPRYKSWDLS